MDTQALTYATLAVVIMFLILKFPYLLIMFCQYFKQYRLAVAICNVTLALPYNKAKFYVNRSWAHMSLAHYQLALEDSNQAINHNPMLALAYNNRGIAYLQLKQYPQALQSFDRAIELKSDVSLMYFCRGTLHNHLKEYQLALQDFDRALTLQPRHALSHHNRGIVYLGLHNFEQGQADILKAQELNPQFIIHGWMVEWCKLCTETPDAAMADRLEALAARNPRDYVAYICLGIALWLRGRFDESLAELEQSLIVKPDVMGAYFWIGMAHASSGRYTEAKTAIERALELGLPPLLLAPLRLQKDQQSAFYIES